MNSTIGGLAVRLAKLLPAADIAALSAEDADALDKLADVVTWELREQITARKRALWRETAVVVPLDVLAGWTRTVIVNGDANPDWISDAALVQRTDTGQFYIVSTNSEETLTWRSDADGTRCSDPRSGSTEDVIYAASGRGMTRAEAVTAIDRTDQPRPGLPSWDDAE